MKKGLAFHTITEASSLLKDMQYDLKQARMYFCDKAFALEDSAEVKSARAKEIMSAIHQHAILLCDLTEELSDSL